MSSTEQARNKWQPLLFRLYYLQSPRTCFPAERSRRRWHYGPNPVRIYSQGSIILSESVPLLFSLTLSFSPFPNVGVDANEGAVREGKELTWEQEMDIPLLVLPPTPGGLLLDGWPHLSGLQAPHGWRDEGWPDGRRSHFCSNMSWWLCSAELHGMVRVCPVPRASMCSTSV